MLYQMFPAIKPAFQAVKTALVKETIVDSWPGKTYQLFLFNEDGTVYLHYEAHLAEYAFFMADAWCKGHLKREI